MSEENSSTSQSEEIPEVFQDDSQEFDVREAFNLPPKKVDDEESEEGEQSVNDKTPAIEDIVTKKTIVKFNKEDVEIDEDKIPELLQKGLALDKERDRAKQSQNDLDRAAKLLGYADHAALSAGLDALEKDQLQAQETKFEKDRQKLIDDLVYNGADEAAAIEFIDNNPLIQQGKKALEAQQKVSADQAEYARWKPLYDKHPDIKALADKGDFSWYTPELAELTKRNDPLLAYNHLNEDTVQTQTKKQVEQKLIKQQQLSSRSKVADDGAQENRASEELRNAFSLFGIDPKRAQKYAK